MLCTASHKMPHVRQCTTICFNVYWLECDMLWFLMCFSIYIFVRVRLAVWIYGFGFMEILCGHSWYPEDESCRLWWSLTFPLISGQKSETFARKFWSLTLSGKYYLVQQYTLTEFILLMHKHETWTFNIQTITSENTYMNGKLVYAFVKLKVKFYRVLTLFPFHPQS